MSQSEADFRYMRRLAEMTQDQTLLVTLFRQSFKHEKTKRNDYVTRLVREAIHAVNN